ncbi:hypothetical protein F2Q68_00042485 [Brassica cretica]|uniref:AAA+ ATPase domain-containing protein n=1 Tax=Brassica cretica TaxID=69181 RepID=A0A8S9MG89_BRACR|nr:hypothetical protein F2Q68_00042485 [Brassica cretica]
MRCVVEERPLQPVIVGQETMLERAWNRLMDDETGIMGFNGMGGVGKTTLLKQINNKFCEANYDFEIVIWVVVSSDLPVEKIQADIAEELGLRRETRHKVTDIHAHMKNKKFVLLLDDIWRKVDLTEIGVPFPTRENGCKVVFTTRSREVCGRMGVDDPMEVRCLTNNEAWNLFEKKVGQLTLKSHPSIPEQARKVAEKCCGLPLALSVIGETMSSKRTIQEWDHAVQVLNSYAADFAGMDDQILPILKYSYDNLKDDHIKSCFLYCSLFTEDYLIEKEKLIDHWICERFINENEDRERTLNQGYDIIGTLVRSCLLLEEGSNKLKVKMHDVVREMALWISSDLGENREKCIVRAVVLDLSQYSRYNLKQLPEEISELVSLKYLDLSRTEIVELHLWKLKKLMHLYLEGMRCLWGIDGISNLSSLRTLTLLDCKQLSFDKSWEELLLLKHLEVLTIQIESKLVLEKLFFSQMGKKCIQKVVIKDIMEESNFSSLTGPCFLNLSSVVIEKCWWLNDLTWLLFAPNLIHLSLMRLRQPKEVVSKEKADEMEVKGIIPFGKLETLVMVDLPAIESIYWTPLPFPCLREMYIHECPKLRKLPLDSRSVAEVENFVIEYGPADWIRGVKWEDKATRLRFRPSRRAEKHPDSEETEDEIEGCTIFRAKNRGSEKNELDAVSVFSEIVPDTVVFDDFQSLIYTSLLHENLVTVNIFKLFSIGLVTIQGIHRVETTIKSGEDPSLALVQKIIITTFTRLIMSLLHERYCNLSKTHLPFLTMKNTHSFKNFLLIPQHTTTSPTNVELIKWDHLSYKFTGFDFIRSDLLWMGGCISIQVACDQVLNRVGSCFCGKGNHIGNLEKNLVDLEKSMGVLKARRDDVLTRVGARGRSKRSPKAKRSPEVENLKSSGVFGAVALKKPAVRCVVEERPLQPVIFGQGKMLETAWNRVMDDETGTMMGLYGMGGVGKTTLLTQISKRFRETADGAQIIIWIVVSSDLWVEKIRDDIAEKLGLRGEAWNQKEERHKVNDIHTHMEDKKFVLLLDDIWRKVDLTEIGVPFPTRENGCKVIFTTRSREVCGHMGVDDPMEVQCLTDNEAWDLFEKKVKLHDVVREMSLWISSDFGENRENCIVRAGVGLCEVPKVEKWSAVEKMSLMINKIEEISGSPNFPKLTTLFLQENRRLGSISGEFFKCMPKLVVLDLSENLGLNRLPEELSELNSLKYLDLSRTMILRLPVGLWKLKKLVHLYLEGMRDLLSMDGISKLSSLRTLKLLGCKQLRFDKSWKELVLLKHVEILTIEIKSKLVLEKLFFSHMGRRCVEKVVIKGTWQESFGFLNFSTILRSLKGSCFLNLSSVAIKDCGLKDLKWLLFAPNLIHLTLVNLMQLEEVVSIEEADEMQVQGIVLFGKLETLLMSDLPEVKSIYGTPLAFPCLREMDIEQCPKLGKLPLSSKSVAEVERFVIIYRSADWIERVNWEDEATRLRFLPSRRMKGRLKTVSAGFNFSLHASAIPQELDWARNHSEDTEIETDTKSGEEIKIERPSWNTDPTSSCFFNLSQVIIHVCSSLKDLNWLLFAPNITYLMIEQLE